jgi:hypothetical protein
MKNLILLLVGFATAGSNFLKADLEAIFKY